MIRDYKTLHRASTAAGLPGQQLRIPKNRVAKKSTASPKLWLKPIGKMLLNLLPRPRQNSQIKKQQDVRVKSVFDKTGRAKSVHKVTLSTKRAAARQSWKLGLVNFGKRAFRLPLFILALIFDGLGSQTRTLTRIDGLKTAFVAIFGILVVNFVQLQVIADNGIVIRNRPGLVLSVNPATRGSIFIRDMQANNKPIEVTSSRVLYNIFIEPDKLQARIRTGSLTREEAIDAVAGSLNISRQDIAKIINEELDKNPPSQYRLIQKFVSKEQKEAAEYLRYYGYKTAANFSTWLGIEQVEVRSYPDTSFLASLGSTIGYVQREPVTRNDALKIAGCRDMVRGNEARRTVNSHTGRDEDGRYIVGIYGIEQKFCSELGGLNGRQLLGSEVGSKTKDDVAVVHGSDIFLTIDKNIQLKAQEVLDELVRINTNSQGGPVNGTIIILDLKRNPGAILAMANYPFVDPNEYYKNLNGFRNTATSVDYEVGSVMKPLTVAAALNEYHTGQVDKNGKRLGIPPEATFLGYDDKGKPYPENNGRILYLRNADGMSYLSRGPQSISNCLRDSINTCLADIQPTLGNLKTKEYFENRFLIGQKTLVSLPGDEHGDIRPLQENIYSDYTYASFGFGQGFTMSPLQLVRAYTPLANDGKLIEPYLVDRIVDSKNRIYKSDDLDAPESIRQKAQVQVLHPTVSKLVTEYLVNAVDQGYLGARPSKGKVPGYTIAGKTGTAQVSRAYKGTPCGYDCNTLLGIYDHTYIGYGPARSPEILVLVKLSEPQPGVIRNYAENTLGPGFSAITGWTLNYLGVPKEAGR